MEQIWKRLYDSAKNVLNPRKISNMMEAGGVAAAVESSSGKISICAMMKMNWSACLV